MGIGLVMKKMVELREKKLALRSENSNDWMVDTIAQLDKALETDMSQDDLDCMLGHLETGETK